MKYVILDQDMKLVVAIVFGEFETAEKYCEENYWSKDYKIVACNTL